MARDWRLEEAGNVWAGDAPEEGDIPESEGWEGREPELDQWGISSGGFGGEP